MSAIDIYVRYSRYNKVLGKIDTLTNEKGLIFRDEGGNLKAHIKTALKFTTLTTASPLITIARDVRSIAFVFTTNGYNRAIREFIGGLATPFVIATCLAGTLFSSLIYVITRGKISFYVEMRRTYAFFEAWVNKINLHSPNLPSYSQRSSNPTQVMNTSNWPQKHVWTTAPCMQPLLEKGYSKKGGLLDTARMQKMFPFLKVNNMKIEKGNQVVIQSQYEDKDIHYIALDGACEHHHKSETFCCCYRIESIYDRFLCCEVGQGTCRSIENAGDSCGIITCSVCGIEGCCCYLEENNQINVVSTGCFGLNQGSILVYEKVA